MPTASLILWAALCLGQLCSGHVCPVESGRLAASVGRPCAVGDGRGAVRLGAGVATGCQGLSGQEATRELGGTDC
jgi:hypothetical protein